MNKKLEKKIALLPEIFGINFYYKYKPIEFARAVKKGGLLLFYEYSGYSLWCVPEDLDCITFSEHTILHPGPYDFYDYHIDLKRAATEKEVADELYYAYYSIRKSKLSYIHHILHRLYDEWYVNK